MDTIKYTDPAYIMEQYNSLIHEHASKVYMEYAKSKAEYENLDRRKGAMLSAIMAKMNDGSNADRKMRAEASPEWLSYISGLNHAYLEYTKKQSVKKYLEDKIDWCRTMLANIREEVKRGI